MPPHPRSSHSPGKGVRFASCPEGPLPGEWCPKGRSAGGGGGGTSTGGGYSFRRVFGYRSVLALVPEDDARCFCVGTPGLEGSGQAAKGNPYSVACASIPPDDSPLPFKQDGLLHCMDHTMGFAGMVEPLTQFAMDAVASEAGRRHRIAPNANE